MFKIITFFMITLFLRLCVRVGILLIRVCSVIIFLLVVVLSVLCFTVSVYTFDVFQLVLVQIK